MSENNVIPKYYGVKDINNYAFWNAQRVTSLVIPESVTALGNNAFGNLSALANVSLSKELIDSIDLENVFPNCPNFHEDGITILKDSIFKATGKTAKKKTKKGTYKIKVKVMSTGNAEYKASDWKTVTVTIKIK